MNFSPRHIQAPAVPFPNMRPMGDVGPMPRTCCWPMWNHVERATHRYCGAPAAIGRVYCPAHAQRAYLQSGGAKFPLSHFPMRGGAVARAVPAEPPLPAPAPAAPTTAAAPRKRKPRAVRSAIGGLNYFQPRQAIDIRKCRDDAERAFVAAINGGATNGEMANRLGKTPSAISGIIWRIKQRPLPE